MESCVYSYIMKYRAIVSCLIGKIDWNNHACQRVQRFRRGKKKKKHLSSFNLRLITPSSITLDIAKDNEEKRKNTAKESINVTHV